MEHIYHVQNEVVAYYKHIPIIPEYVAIDEKLIFDMTESQYIQNLSYFTELMKSIYKDMEVRPIEYGLLQLT